MALTLPLHLLDGFCRCCGLIPTYSLSAIEQKRLAELIIADASLFDVIRWRRVSAAFRRAADCRLQNYIVVNVRMYNGISHLQKHTTKKNGYAWHLHANVMIVELGPHELGVGIDSNIKPEDVRALVHVLSAFRDIIQQLFIDSPVIEMLVSQINRQQVNVLLGILQKFRKISSKEDSTLEYVKSSLLPVKIPSVATIMIINQPDSLPYGPFFPHLKKLVITSQSNQLEHLSRLINYSVGVDLLYKVSEIDLLCLKIYMGKNAQWYQKQHYRMFRHVTKFRQWTHAASLGERYFQQFSGKSKKLGLTRH